MQTADDNRHSVFISGASSGIGRACALHLDKAGFSVIAAVRKQADAEALRGQASPRLQTVFMDVADSASIEAAAAAVSRFSQPDRLIRVSYARANRYSIFIWRLFGGPANAACSDPRTRRRLSSQMIWMPTGRMLSRTCKR